jgi:hypothetical protein
VAGADLVSPQIRDYVLCPGQTYWQSQVQPDFSVIGGFPAFDYQLLIVNPNFKVSCESCTLEAAKPASAEESGWGNIVVPDFPSIRAALGSPTFVPDASGLIIDGLTFTQEPGSSKVFAVVAIQIVNEMKLPAQIRNVVVRDITVAGQIINVASDAFQRRRSFLT